MKKVGIAQNALVINLLMQCKGDKASSSSFDKNKMNKNYEHHLGLKEYANYKTKFNSKFMQWFA